MPSLRCRLRGFGRSVIINAAALLVFAPRSDGWDHLYDPIGKRNHRGLRATERKLDLDRHDWLHHLQLRTDERLRQLCFRHCGRVGTDHPIACRRRQPNLQHHLPLPAAGAGVANDVARERPHVHHGAVHLRGERARFESHVRGLWGKLHERRRGRRHRCGYHVHFDPLRRQPACLGRHLRRLRFRQHARSRRRSGGGRYELHSHGLYCQPTRVEPRLRRVRFRQYACSGRRRHRWGHQLQRHLGRSNYVQPPPS